MAFRLGLSVLILLSVSSAASGQSDKKYKKLIRVIRTDESYKVRMQALRVLMKRLDGAGKKPSDNMMEELAIVAQHDPERLVRGLACVSLGSFEDPRARPALEKALQDKDPFVRVQAEEALARTPKPKVAGGQALVVGTDQVPGVTVPPEIQTALSELLESGFRATAAGFAVGDKNGKGYHMKGSIANLQVVPDGDGSRVTVVVKIAIATWPDNNLRHVMSATASARVKSASGPSLIRLQRKLLEAAVKKAIQDSMAAIGGG